MDNPSDPLGEVCEPIRSQMRMAGCSINRLAKNTKIPYTTLHRRLASPEQLTVRDLIKIAEALGASPVDIWPAPFADQAVAS